MPELKIMTRNSLEEIISGNSPQNCTPQILVWDNLDCAAHLAPLAPTIDQCSIQIGGHEVATLFLFRDVLAGMVEVHFCAEPDDAAYIALGRTVRAHQLSCQEGRAFL